MRFLRYGYYIGRTVRVHDDYIFTFLCWLQILPYKITTTRSRCILNLWDSLLWITVLLSRNTKKMQLCNGIYYSKVFLKAQRVSSGTPLIIRSSKLYLQPLYYMPIWWPAVAKPEWEISHFPLSLGNGRSPYGHIIQRLQIEFRAPDDERCAARNTLSL